MSNLARAWWIFFALLAVGLGTFYFVAAAHLFPAMGGDAAAHIVPVLNYKSGHGFGSVVWSLTRTYDPTGQHRFLQYPPLFHLAVAGLIRHAAAADVYECLAGFTVAGLALYAVLVGLLPVAGAARRQPRWSVLACVSLGAVSTWFYPLPSSGRAEALATPLVILAVMAVWRSPLRWQPVVAGVFIGILGATQTAVALLAGLFYATYVSRRWDGSWGATAHRAENGAAKAAGTPDAGGLVQRWLTPVALAGAVSLVVFTACFLFSPYSMLETVRGISFHLAQLPGTDLSVFSYYVFPAVPATFYGLFFAVLLAHDLWWHGHRLSALSAANLGAFVVAAWVLAIHHPNRCYNLLPFAPVLVALALHLVAQLETPDAHGGAAPGTGLRRWRGGVYAVYFGVFALMSIGFARQVALYAVFSRRGVSYAEAERAYLATVPPGDHTPILFDSGVFTLLDHFDHTYQRLRESFDPLDSVPEPTRPTLLVHQWYGRLASPPQIPGYRLVWNDFVREPPPRVLGLKIANAMPGYAFAVYQPDSP